MLVHLLTHLFKNYSYSAFLGPYDIAAGADHDWSYHWVLWKVELTCELGAKHVLARISPTNRIWIVAHGMIKPKINNFHFEPVQHSKVDKCFQVFKMFYVSKWFKMFQNAWKC